MRACSPPAPPRQLAQGPQLHVRLERRGAGAQEVGHVPAAHHAPGCAAPVVFRAAVCCKPACRWRLQAGSCAQPRHPEPVVKPGLLRPAPPALLPTPAGVRPSADGADVASPVSLMEWFMSFYEHKNSVGCAPVEFIQEAGELVFVPVSAGGAVGWAPETHAQPAVLPRPAGKRAIYFH